MKSIKNRLRHFFYLSIICVLTLFAIGCGDDEKTEARHVPGVYTGTYDGNFMSIVVGEKDITSVMLTVYNSDESAVEMIDITGSWPLVWDDDNYCYDFVFTITTSKGMNVTIDGVAGIDIDGNPAVQGKVLEGDTTTTELFYVNLQS